MSENRRSIIIEAVLPPRQRKTSSRTYDETKPAKKQRLDLEVDSSTGAIKKTVIKPPKVTSHIGVPHVSRRTATLPVSPFAARKKHHISVSSTKVSSSSDKTHSKVVAATITREGQVTPQVPIKLPTQHIKHNLRSQNFDLEQPVPKPRIKGTRSPKTEKHQLALTGVPERAPRNLESSKKAREPSNSPMVLLEKQLMEEYKRTRENAVADFSYSLNTPENPARKHYNVNVPKANYVFDVFTTDHNAVVPFRSVPLQASLATPSNNNANVYATPTATRETAESLPTQNEENQQQQPAAVDVTPVVAQRLIKCECAPDVLFHDDLETILDANTVPENVLHRLRRLALGSLGQLLRELQSYGFESPILEDECPVIALAMMRNLLEEEELAFQGLVQASAITIPKTPLRTPKTAVDQNEDIELEGAVALPPTPGPQPFGYCLICWEKAREVAFVPCGHVACCEQCADSEMLHVCPTCRGEILDTVRVFLP